MVTALRHGWIVCCLVLAACSGAGYKPGPGSTYVAELPEPNRADLANTSQAYYAGPFDELVIDVYGVEELSKKVVQVDASGRISFPFAGEIIVSGLTPLEISQEIAAGLRRGHFRDPEVSVNLQKTVSQNFTVEGEVKEPGVYPLLGRTSLMRAIASAKGPTEFSKLTNVIIFRTVQGQRYAALYNLKAIRAGTLADPDVYANDIIAVDESRARRIFRDMLQVTPLLTYPLIAALQN